MTRFARPRLDVGHRGTPIVVSIVTTMSVTVGVNIVIPVRRTMVGSPIRPRVV